ncbi:MAG TPA: hypothetical protein PK922_09080 [Syntrophorhabdus sp.]|nr:hypothetical protein [Syntrophorhabdus sp.]
MNLTRIGYEKWKVARMVGRENLINSTNIDKHGCLQLELIFY